jgi:hypothetical protein
VIFPNGRLDFVVEIFVNGAWIDITSADVRYASGIGITRGIPNESSSANPANVALTLDDRDGNYASDNPLSIYYGSIGRNTPIRAAINLIRDLFSRNVSNGWGTTTSGHVWTTNLGAGGTVQASDFAVNGSAGTMLVPVADAHRRARIGTPDFRDVDVAYTWDISVNAIIAGSVSSSVTFRESGTDYYRAVTTITSSTVDVSATDTAGNLIGSSVTVPSLVFSGSPLRVRAQMSGQQIRIKAWLASASEPFDWHIVRDVINDPVTAETAPGFVFGDLGLRFDVSAGVNPAAPYTASFDDVVVRIMRATAEISSLPHAWNENESDIRVPMNAAGILRRLGQPSSPVLSPYRRAMLSQTANPVVAYWPCEDLAGSTSIASAVSRVIPMDVVGTANFAANSDFVSSVTLPQFNGSKWFGTVAPYVGNDLQIRFMLSIPSTGTTEDTIVCEFWVKGTAPKWVLTYEAANGGSLTLNIYDPAVGGELPIVIFNPVANNLNGQPVIISMELVQNGADIDWTVGKLLPGSMVPVYVSDTVEDHTFNKVGLIRFNLLGQMTGVTVGHISIQGTVDDLADIARPFEAWMGETAGDRIIRLGEENSIAVSVIGDASTTEPMGYQGISSFLELAQECANADLSFLYESHDTFGLSFRTRQSLYNQTATVTLDHDQRHISLGLTPSEDDRNTANDVTAVRTGGSQFRATLDSGPMSTQDPPDGVGRYETRVTVNVESDSQLKAIAEWLLHLGTTRDRRYERVPVNFASLHIANNEQLRVNLLTLGVGDRFVIYNPPILFGAEPITQLALGFTEFFGTDAHRMDLVSSPESPYHVFILGQSRLDSTTSRLASGINTTTTSLSVASTNVLWTTAVGQFPFDVSVGGERMTVTTISGASSPQTFTVTRSANGVVKSHSSDAQVSLSDPTYLAM